MSDETSIDEPKTFAYVDNLLHALDEVRAKVGPIIETSALMTVQNNNKFKEALSTNETFTRCVQELERLTPAEVLLMINCFVTAVNKDAELKIEGQCVNVALNGAEEYQRAVTAMYDYMEKVAALARKAVIDKAVESFLKYRTQKENE
jgi:hypothetical protein